MKPRLFVFCLLLIVSCQKEQKETQKPSFLIGDWIRINNKEDSVTYEMWNSNLEGLGYTLKGKDTTFKEILSIVSIKDTLFLKVEGVNKEATLFKFTQQTDTSFVCKNSKNEFPKQILYYIENRLLKAVVSSEDLKIDFIFNKNEL